MQMLMEEKRCIKGREAFPPEFWNHTTSEAAARKRRAYANPIGKIQFLKKEDGEPLGEKTSSTISSKLSSTTSERNSLTVTSLTRSPSNASPTCTSTPC